MLGKMFFLLSPEVTDGSVSLLQRETDEFILQRSLLLSSVLRGKEMSGSMSVTSSSRRLWEAALVGSIAIRPRLP